MPFDLTRWREIVRHDVERLATDPVLALHEAGVASLYGFLLGSAIFPVAVAYSLDPQSALVTLMSVIGGVGGNLVANWIQSKYDKVRTCAVAVDEAQQPQLAPIYDAIAKQVDIFPLADQALQQAGHPALVERLRAELQQYGKLDQYLGQTLNLQQTGSLNIAHSTNYGPTVGSVSGNGQTFIATNQVLSNITNSSLPSPHMNNVASQGQGLPEEEIEHKRKLFADLTRRLQQLQRQAAQKDINTSLETETEMKDLMLQIEQLQRELSV